MKITIPSIPPSLNKFAGRMNCWEYRKIKQDWIRMVRAYVKKPEKPFDHALVKITYYFPTRVRHDPDNYAGKMILDGLTYSGVIVDDSFEHITLQIAGGHEIQRERAIIIWNGRNREKLHSGVYCKCIN